MMNRSLQLALADPLIWLGLMEIELEDYQLEIFLSLSADYHNRIIVDKSRQVGLSWLLCLYALIMSHIRDDVMCVLVSYKAQDSSDKITIIKSLYDKIPSRYRKKIMVNNRTNLEFKGGSEIRAQGKNHVRGVSSDKFLILVLDEFAFYGNIAEVIYTSIQGLWTRAKAGSSLSVISTPFFENGKYWDIWSDTSEYGNFKRFYIAWWHFSGLVKTGMLQEARKIAPILSTDQRVKKYGNDILQNIFKSMSLLSFCQEFEGAFSAAAGCYFDLTSVQSIFKMADLEEDKNPFVFLDTFEEIAEKYKRYDIYLGYDVASGDGSDYSALVVLVDLGSKLVVPYAKKMKVKFRNQKELLRNAFEMHELQKGYVEKNSIGAQLAQEMEEEFSGTAEGVTTSQTSKVDSFALLKKLIEDKQIEIPSDKDLLTQIMSVRQGAGQNGKTIIKIDHSRNGHGDTIMALTLALRAWNDSKNGDYVTMGRINI